jgi:hypothetical protein
MNIFYIIFGDNIIHHVQAYLSIRSFQQQTEGSDRLIVVTTKPELYARAGIAVEPVTDAVIKEWEGEYRFFWRVKIKAMEYLCAKYPEGHLLYLDTDTFLYGQLGALKAKLDEGCGMMHLDEGHPSAMKTKSLRMWKQVAGRQYAGITIGRHHNMWNAGVVAIPESKKQDVVATALAICDSMLADGVERVVIEQYSLSIALHEKTHLVPADGYIGHYWGNKSEWERMAYDVIARAYMKNLSVADELEALDISKLAQTPIFVRRSSTAKRLSRFIAKIFKDGEKRRVNKLTI